MVFQKIKNDDTSDTDEKDKTSLAKLWRKVKYIQIFQHVWNLG